jgi:hypothetical protein
MLGHTVTSCSPRVAHTVHNMLSYLAAFAIAFFLAPLFTGLVELACSPVTIIVMSLLLPKRQDDNPRPPARVLMYALLVGLTSIGSAFAAVWFARLLFGWFHLSPTLVIAWALAIAYGLNGLREVKASGGAMVLPKFTRAVGDLLGIFLGAKHFL